jgi:pyruvate formate lyase activating enzyme
MEGFILDIQKLSTEDGPGIRTTVFFKGCNLRCAWCHNPESIPAKSQAVWVKARCIGCGSCVKSCPKGALTFGAGGVVADQDKCTGCLTCAESCPTGAMERKGVVYTTDALGAELLKDKTYFEKSGGGVTASGGEPLLQAALVRELFRTLRGENVHTALDTAANVPWEVLASVLEVSDMLLLDIKMVDNALHRRFTGVSNARILDNAARAAQYAREHGTALWVRTPVIPGATDSEENVAAVGAFIALNMAGTVHRWELCAFNNLCRDKYERLGQEWDYKDEPLMRRADMERLRDIAAQSAGLDVTVVWTGAVRRETIGKEGGIHAGQDI